MSERKDRGPPVQTSYSDHVITFPEKTETYKIFIFLLDLPGISYNRSVEEFSDCNRWAPGLPPVPEDVAKPLSYPSSELDVLLERQLFLREENFIWVQMYVPRSQLLTELINNETLQIRIQWATPSDP